MTQLAAPATVRWRLGNRTRKSVLVLHIASAGAWLGVDVVMGVLIFTALLRDDPAIRALRYRALLVAMVLAIFKPWGRIRQGR
jgi:hypothetical protein